MTFESEAYSHSWVTSGTDDPEALPFPFLEHEDVIVTLTPPGDTAIALVLGADYTISGDSRSGNASLQPLAAWDAGQTAFVVRRTSRVQLLDLVANERFSAEGVEYQLDRQMMALREVEGDRIDLESRSIRLPEGETLAPMPSSAGKTGYYPVWDGSQFVWSLGTGAAGGLRGDLAADDGVELVNGAAKTDLTNVAGAQRLELAPAITVSGDGGFDPANTPLLISGTMGGTGSGFLQNFATFNVADTMGLDGLTPGQHINCGYFNLGTLAGAGPGSRNAVHAVLGHYAPTNPGPGQSFKTAVFATTYVAAGDGGSPGDTKGDFFGFGGIVTLKTGVTHVHGAIGAEFDVAVESGASVDEKIILQIVTVNGDATKGSVADAGIAIMGDGTTSARLDYGIAFGKPTARHVADTLMGGYSSVSNGLTSNYGIDLANFTFNNYAFRSNGFSVDPAGVVAAKALTLSRGFTEVRMNDTSATPTTGGLVRLTGQTGNWLFQINTAVAADFSSSIQPYSIASNGRVTFGLPVAFPAFTVATLPTASPAGQRAFVSNANATTFNSIVAGGGANYVPVFSDGTNWRIG